MADVPAFNGVSAAGPHRAGWQFCIDRGGTFTAVVGRRPAGAVGTHTLPSDNPGPREGRARAALLLGRMLPQGAARSLDDLCHIAIGNLMPQ